MRTLFILSICLISRLSYSQTGIKTDTFVVSGNCEQCKERIENAADIKGVKILTWNAKTQIATVKYNSEKVTLTQIEEAIAAKGHDVGPIKATDASYSKLPKCCKYRDGKHEELEK